MLHICSIFSVVSEIVCVCVCDDAFIAYTIQSLNMLLFFNVFFLAVLIFLLALPR